MLRIGHHRIQKHTFTGTLLRDSLAVPSGLHWATPEQIMNIPDQFRTPKIIRREGSDAVPCLRSFNLLSHLSDEQFERVEKHATSISLEKHQALFKQGDSVENFYLVLSGRIMLSRTSTNGEEKTIEFITAGKMFAEALMFGDQPVYPVTATAIEKSTVVGLNATDFRLMLHESVDTCFLLLGDMSARLHSLIREIDTLSMHTGSCRVATYLMQNTPPGQDRFKLSIAKRIIASRLSVKPETFSRILNEMHQKGVLTVEGSTITIHDRDALAALCIDNG